MTIADDLATSSIQGLPPTVANGAVPIVGATRGDLVESVHLGHIAVTGPHGLVAAAGDAHTLVFARSAMKPFQTAAMVDMGLDLPAEHLALVAASHSGEAAHLAAVEQILAAVGLTPADLETTPGLPIGEAAREHVFRTGQQPAAIFHDCSGKHAGMLTTAVINGWPTAGYLNPDHPVQQGITKNLGTMLPLAEPESVDGCGAPLVSCRLDDLATAIGQLCAAPEDTTLGRVAAAMRHHPTMVGGPGRLVTQVMERIPGVLAKDGAEAVLVLGDTQGRGAAVKVLDGNPRALRAAAQAIGARWDWPIDDMADILVRHQLGHGKPKGVLGPIVGMLRPVDD